MAMQFYFSCRTFSSLSLSLPQGKSASVNGCVCHNLDTPERFYLGDRFLHGLGHKGECSQHLPAGGFESSREASPNSLKPATARWFSPTLATVSISGIELNWNCSDIKRKTVAHSSSPDMWAVSAGNPESGRLGLES